MSVDVSVIVPIYNSENTLEVCIESIICQSFRDIEVVLVNDGSQDKSGDICERYVRKDSRVRVIHQKNAGRSVARYVGVMNAVGEWVTFVDSDDKLPLTAISSLLKSATDDTDIVFGNGYSLLNEHRTVIPLEEFRHMTVRGEGTIGVPWGALYRHSLLTHYAFDVPREICMGEDYIFWLRLVFRTEKAVNIVYENVYDKGGDTTSSCFVWTAEYAGLINDLRKESIPKEEHELYLNDMLDDRIANLMGVVLQQPRRNWIRSDFYKEIIRDMSLTNRTFTIKQKMFLVLPSVSFRKISLRILNMIRNLLS